MSFFDLFSILIWLVPSIIMIVWLVKKIKGTANRLKMEQDARSFVFYESMKAELKAKGVVISADNESNPSLHK